MKIIELTSATQNRKIHLVIGPGIFFTKAEDNKATAISGNGGVILVTETIEQIAEAIKNQGEQSGIS